LPRRSLGGAGPRIWRANPEGAAAYTRGGGDIDTAVVEPEARAVLTSFEQTVVHYEVVAWSSSHSMSMPQMPCVTLLAYRCTDADAPIGSSRRSRSGASTASRL
jgi:hypothetical protein